MNGSRAPATGCNWRLPTPSTSSCWTSSLDKGFAKRTYDPRRPDTPSDRIQPPPASLIAGQLDTHADGHSFTSLPHCGTVPAAGFLAEIGAAAAVRGVRPETRRVSHWHCRVRPAMTPWIRG